MSYDIYSYKSLTGTPDPDELDAIVEADEDQWSYNQSSESNKERAVSLLKASNSRLMAFEGPAQQGEKASRKTVRHIELNPPEGDPAIQITAYDNHVFFSVPYWYTGTEAAEVMDQLKSYIKVLRTELGYFVYDPQTGQAFDPAEHEFNGIANYLKVSSEFDKTVTVNEVQKAPMKPWWKFWA